MNQLLEHVKHCMMMLSGTTVTVVSTILESSYILLHLTLHRNNVGQISNLQTNYQKMTDWYFITFYVLLFS